MSLPYYSMYPKDFDSDDAVRSMEDCELGLYIRCLNHSWINDGLPEDPEEIRRRFRDSLEEFTRKWKRVETCFPVAADGKRRNPRQEKERASASRAHEAAVKRASKRWGSCRGNAPAMPEHARSMSSTSGSGSGSGSGSSTTLPNTEKAPTRAREEMPPISNEPETIEVTSEVNLDLEDPIEVFIANASRRNGGPRIKLNRRADAPLVGRLVAAEERYGRAEVRGGWLVFLPWSMARDDIKAPLPYFLSAIERFLPSGELATAGDGAMGMKQEASPFQKRMSGGTPPPPIAYSAPQGQSGVVQSSALEPSIQPIMDELEHIYRLAGAPIAEKHKQLAMQLVLAIPPEKRSRLPNYCKWAIRFGKWPDASKTKSLLNVLRDGDWDVEIVPRTLPETRRLSARELAHQQAAAEFLREGEHQ